MVNGRSRWKLTSPAIREMETDVTVGVNTRWDGIRVQTDALFSSSPNFHKFRMQIRESK